MELLLIALSMGIAGLTYKLITLLAECGTPKEVVLAVAVAMLLVSTMLLGSIFGG